MIMGLCLMLGTLYSMWTFFCFTLTSFALTSTSASYMETLPFEHIQMHHKTSLFFNKHTQEILQIFCYNQNVCANNRVNTVRRASVSPESIIIMCHLCLQICHMFQCVIQCSICFQECCLYGLWSSSISSTVISIMRWFFHSLKSSLSLSPLFLPSQLASHSRGSSPKSTTNSGLGFPFHQLCFC